MCGLRVHMQSKNFLPPPLKKAWEYECATDFKWKVLTYYPVWWEEDGGMLTGLDLEGEELFPGSLYPGSVGLLLSLSAEYIVQTLCNIHTKHYV